MKEKEKGTWRPCIGICVDDNIEGKLNLYDIITWYFFPSSIKPHGRVSFSYFFFYIFSLLLKNSRSYKFFSSYFFILAPLLTAIGCRLKNNNFYKNSIFFFPSPFPSWLLCAYEMNRCFMLFEICEEINNVHDDEK